MSIYLLIGILLFCQVHLFPATLVTHRKTIIGRIGQNPYKGLYSLLILIALILIVFGWRDSNAEYIYEPPKWGYLATEILMYPALFLFVSARANSNIKRIIRHPQLASIFLWGVAHLLANGDSRSVILFGLFALWSLIEMLFLNRRDGDWNKPEQVSYFVDIRAGLIALVLYIGLAYGHIYYTGIPLTFS